MICRDPGSNRGPSDLQSDALPTELSRHVCIEIFNDRLKARPHGLGGKCQANCQAASCEEGFYPKDVCKLLFLDCATVFVLTGGVPQGLWLYFE